MKASHTPGPIISHDAIQGHYRADIGWAVLKSATWNISCADFTSKATIANYAEDTLAALRQLVDDSECYCCDTVAAKGPCGYCVAKSALAKATGKEAKP